MFVINYNGEIIEIKEEELINDKIYYSTLWKQLYNINLNSNEIKENKKIIRNFITDIVLK